MVQGLRQVHRARQPLARAPEFLEVAPELPPSPPAGPAGPASPRQRQQRDQRGDAPARSRLGNISAWAASLPRMIRTPPHLPAHSPPPRPARGTSRPPRQPRATPPPALNPVNKPSGSTTSGGSPAWTFAPRTPAPTLPRHPQAGRMAGASAHAAPPTWRSGFTIHRSTRARPQHPHLQRERSLARSNGCPPAGSPAATRSRSPCVRAITAYCFQGRGEPLPADGPGRPGSSRHHVRVLEVLFQLDGLDDRGRRLLGRGKLDDLLRVEAKTWAQVMIRV